MKAKTPIRNARVPVTPSRGVTGFLDFGSANLFPQELINSVSTSLTAGSCIKRRAQFIAGNGFNDARLAKLIVNRKGQTLDAFLRRQAWNVAFGECFCAHIQYNGLGKIAGINFVPWEAVRLGKPDDLDNISKAGIFPYIGSTVFTKKTKEKTELTLFNPNPEVVQKEIEIAGGIEKYNGQLLYLPMLSTGDNYYHTPDWFKAITVIDTETELDIYDYKQTVNNFAIAGIASILDEETAVIGEDADDTNVEYVPGAKRGTEREIDADSVEYQFIKSIGNRDASNVIFLHHKNKEAMQSFKFESVTGAQLSERNGSLNERTPRKIARAFEVPPELIGIQKPGGIASTGLEMQFSLNYMIQTVNDYQRLIKEATEAMLFNWITPLGDNLDLGIQPLKFLGDTPVTEAPVPGK